MKCTRVQICLVSGQPLPNLLPAIDPEMKAVRIIQVISSDMRQRAKWLADVMSRFGIKISRHYIDDAWDTEILKENIINLLAEEESEIDNCRISLNVTGGTKPMSIAAYEACRSLDIPIFYTHPEKARIIWLYPHGKKSLQLSGKIKLEPFLMAHGVNVQGVPEKNIPDSRIIKTGEEIVNYFDRYISILSTMNWLAATAYRTLKTEAIESRIMSNDLMGLVDLFEENGFLMRDGDYIRFPDEKSRFYVNGGWLEYLVFDSIRKIRKQDGCIQDLALGINIAREKDGKPIPNEIDVAFLHNNRLHIIECKTRKLLGEGDSSPGAEAIYKLDTLAELAGGLQANAMLICYRDVAGAVRRRASDLGVTICAGKQIKNLRTHMQKFIGC